MHKSRNYLSLLLVFSLGFLLIQSCKKYEEGPSFTVKTKKGRLAGIWEVDEVLSDGTVISISGREGTYDFDKEGAFVWDDDTDIDKTGTWEFVNDKEDLQIIFQYEFTQNIVVVDTFLAEIRKLTKDQLWTIEPTEVLGLGTINLEFHYKKI